MAGPGEAAAASADDAEEGDAALLEEQELDEELSPFDPTTEDQPVLYVQIVDERLRPQADQPVIVRGAGIPEPRTLRTDEDGCLLLTDCGPGVYEIERIDRIDPTDRIDRAGAAVARAHTLTQHDLDADTAPYRVLLPVTPAAAATGPSAAE